MAPPTISTNLTLTATDNTSATITFSEAVFQSDGTTALGYNDFGVVVTTGSTAVLDTNNCSVSTTDNTTFTFTLAYSTQADAGDTLKLTGTVYNSVPDSLGLNGATGASVALNDLTPPPPIINPIATSAFSWGSVLNATEDNNDGTVNVTTLGVEDGQPLTITLNGSTYTANVSNNSATVTITATGLQGLTNGQSYTLTADVSDVAGNAATQVTSSPFTVDKTGSVITSIFVASTNNTTTLAKANDVIRFTVAFNDAVTLSSKSDVKVPFTIGGTAKEAIAQSNTTAQIGGRPNAIYFEYTVEAGATGPVALVSGPLTLDNGATVVDAAGNTLLGNMTSLTGTVNVDTTPPTIAITGNTGLIVSGGQTLNSTTYVRAGNTLYFGVEFTESVSWTTASNVSFNFKIDDDTVIATTTATSTDVNNRVAFTYTVAAGKTGTVSLPSNTILDVANGDSIRDVAANTMPNNSYLQAFTPGTAVIVDTTAPTVSLNAGNTKVGRQSTITATISEALYKNGVTITNGPSTDFTVTSSSGATIANISVVSSTSITFDYTPTVMGPDTITFSASTSITDIATNPLTQGNLTFTVTNACFPAGTPIQTDQGIVPIEQINILKNTIRGYKIKALIHSYLTDKNMVLFKRGSLYKNVPSKDTVMSRYHKVYFNKRMSYAKDFVQMGIAQYKSYSMYTPIFNLLLESHENMMINNMIVETQNPQSTVGRFYNDFLLNKNMKPKDIHYAQELLHMFHATPWGEELMKTNLRHLDQFKNVSANFMVKEWFKAYLIQNKNKNKKRVINTMNKLLPISK